MTLSKRANISFTVAFLVFLVTAMIVTIMKPKESVSYYENRELASAPSLSVQSILNGSYFSGWEDYLKDHAAGRITLVKLSAFLDANVIRRPVVNDVVISGGMLLGFNRYETVDKDEISKQSKKMADNMSNLNQTIQNYGGDFYYVAVPGQYTYFSDSYPFYLNNRSEYTELELSDFKADMSERGIRMIDMGTVFQAIGNPHDLYSNADYHYTYYGAFITYQTIMQAINDDRDIGLTALTEQDLTFRQLDNPYMGSRLRKLCNVRQSSEKLVIGLPNLTIPFTRMDNGASHAAAVYSLPNNTWESVTYSAYMGGDVAETIIDTGRPSLPSVLIYGDSFTNPVETLLYYSFNTMRSIDLRGYKTMSLTDYIETYKPDIVICIRDYESLLSLDGNGTVFGGR